MSYKPFKPKMCDSILKRDNYQCVYCGNPATEVDHVIMPKDGGVTNSSNGVACCRSCNQSKKHHPSDITFIARGLFWIATHE